MRLIFLVYKNRSGSTFISNQLSKKKNVCVPPEGGELIDLIISPFESMDSEDLDLFINRLVNSVKFKSWEIERDELTQVLRPEMVRIELLIAILKLYGDKNKPGTSHCVLKHPRILNYLKEFQLEDLVRWNILVVTLIRDGRSIYASSKKSLQSNVPIPMEYNPWKSAEGWSKYLDKVERFNRLFDSRLMVIKYEDYLLDNRKEQDRLLEFVSVSHDISEDSQSDLSSKISDRQRHLHKKIEQAPDTSRILSWREDLSDWELGAYESRAEEGLVRWGYQLSNSEFSSRNKLVAHIRVLVRALTYRSLQVFFLIKKMFSN